MRKYMCATTLLICMALLRERMRQKEKKEERERESEKASFSMCNFAMILIEPGID